MNWKCDHETAARYVAGNLAESELESFEQHLLACDECQTVVREAAAVRSALLTRHRRLRYAALLSPVGLAGAAVIAWFVIAPSQLQKLGRVGEPPAVQPMQVRAGEDSAAVFADRGIVAYRNHDYRTAASLLRRASELKPQAGTDFFAAVAQLMLKRADSAAAGFGRVIESGDAAFLQDAHYYAGKAWLQLGNADSATAHLRASGTPAARALEDSVRRVR